MTRVAIVAAAPGTRARLESVIARNGSLELTISARSIDDIAGDSRLASSEVMLLHGLPADFVARDLEALPPIPIVALLRGPTADGASARLLAIGVRGVLPDDSADEEIVAALEAVVAGLVVLPSERVAEIVRSRPTAHAMPERVLPRPGARQPPVLTPREQEVLSMLAEGLANKGIAARLGISDHTVKTHVEAVFEKLDASTRAEAVARAVRLGLLLL